MHPLLHSLADRSFLVVTGKGGVGKSTVSAALAQTLTQAGRSVLIIEIDPRENIHQLFQVPPSGGDVVDQGGNLYLQNLKPRQALDLLVRDQMGDGFVYNRIVKSSGYHHTAEGAPGLKELAILDYADRRTRERGDDGLGPFDTVILDAPATGHGVTLLAAPMLVTEVLQQGPVGRKARDLADFVADARRLGIVVVALAEEMPVQESLELRRTMDERLGRQPELLVVNALYPPLPEGLDNVPVDSPNHDALAAWYRRRRINERELQRLEAAWDGPQVRLPLLPLDRGLELVAALRQELLAGIEALPTGDGAQGAAS